MVSDDAWRQTGQVIVDCVCMGPSIASDAGF